MNPELHLATALPTAFSQKTQYYTTLLFVWSAYLAYGPSPLPCIRKSIMCNCSILITNVTIMKDLITKRSGTDITVYVLFTIHISQHYNTEMKKDKIKI